MTQIPDTPIPNRSHNTDAVTLLSGMSDRKFECEYSVYECTHYIWKYQWKEPNVGETDISQ